MRIQFLGFATANRFTNNVLAKDSFPSFAKSFSHGRSPLNDSPISKGVGTGNLSLSRNSEDDEIISDEDRKRFDQISQELLKIQDDDDDSNRNTSDFPSLFPTNPFGTSLDKSGGKTKLYSDDELKNVLSLHKELNKKSDVDPSSRIPNQSSSGGFHEMVKASLGHSKDEVPPNIDEQAQRNTFSSTYNNLGISDEIKGKIHQIRAVASDVDGTILTKDQKIHPRTRLAIINAIKESKRGKDDNIISKIDFFFPATGKSRKGALDSLGIEIGNLIQQNCPGVYLQGLFCIGKGGEVVFEKKLNREVIGATESLAKTYGISVVAYDGDNLYTTELSDIVLHLHEHYGEPLPTLLEGSSDESVRSLSSHEPLMHKLLLMDDDTEKLTNEIRPRLEALAKKYKATVTQALPTMLELLPDGCSKAVGVQKLCNSLGIDPEVELLAIGDAENDAGMLKIAAIGVAVANASPPARESSDVIMDYSNDEGGAGVAIEIFALESIK